MRSGQNQIHGPNLRNLYNHPMSDASVIAIITGISAVFTAALTGYFGLQTLRIKQTTETTLKHVNHQVIAAAKQYAVSTRLNAELSQNPGYKQIAEDAESALGELIKAQEQIDRGEAPIA